MLKGKFLHTEKLKDYKNNFGEDVSLSVYGVFDTNSVKWSYYVLSHIGNKITNDICGNVLGNGLLDVYTAKSGKLFNTKEEGIGYINDYKIKWETGSNNTISEIRDKKINDIID